MIGGGPAGSSLAARLAQLGHEVTLIERTSFPRPRLGESLNPAVLPLLQLSGARGVVQAAGFTAVHAVRMRWEHGQTERRDPGARGLLVDRGRFDALLLQHARAQGVRVLQPAVLRTRQSGPDGWLLGVEHDGRRKTLRADLLADATGRRSQAPPNGHSPGAARGVGPGLGEVRTIALYGYWRGAGLPEQPRIEAGADGWLWGVPIPDGTYNTLVFVDAERVRRAGPIAPLFHELLAGSGLLDGCAGAVLAGRVRAADATPYLRDDCVTPTAIKVGDAALAIDPLSSSGVQKAIQSALAGAVVINTMLRRPEDRDVAMAFYRGSLREAAERHRRWAAERYSAAARHRDHPFWRRRAAELGAHDQGHRSADRMTDSTPEMPNEIAAEGATPATPASAEVISATTDPLKAERAKRMRRDARVELSAALEFIDIPCIEDDFVAIRPAVRHPALEQPLAYLGGWPVARLLRQVRSGVRLDQLAGTWAAQLSPCKAMTLARWLTDHRLLVESPQPDAGGAAPAGRDAVP